MAVFSYIDAIGQLLLEPWTWLALLFAMVYLYWVTRPATPLYQGWKYERRSRR